MSTEVQYIDIPLDQLHDSPTQPRLAYDEAYLDELAADIKSHGRNLSPLLVRPRVPELFAAVGDADLARDATAGYEIVFGHCRRRGLERAGLATARCEVRSMTDEQVERAQISENLQRKNVHPFEEAQGFQALIERHKDTADAIAERTGKSRSYIYGRLKLLQACPAVRKACIAGEIDAEVALLIARLRTTKLQEKALHRIDAKAWHLDDGGKRSYRNIRELLQDEFTLDLKKALFDIHDASLLPGADACTTCPKRSANAPEFEDLLQDHRNKHGWGKSANPNLCTDPDCWAAKKTAHLKNEATALQKKVGAAKTVIDGNKARNAIGADGTVKGGYLPMTAETKDLLQKARLKQMTNTKLQPPLVVLIQNPRDGKVVEAVKEADLVALGVVAAKPKGEKAEPDWKRRQREQEAERARKEAQAERATAVNIELLQRVRQAAKGRQRDAVDLYMVTRAALEGVEYSDRKILAHLWDLRGFDDLVKRAGSMSIDDLSTLLLDCALVAGIKANAYNRCKPENMLATAKRYGVSLAPESAKPASTPSPAARASKGTAAKGKKGSAAGDAAVDVDHGSSQAGSAGKEKGGADGAEAGQVEEEGAVS